MDLQTGRARAGVYLQRVLEGIDISQMSTEEFLEQLVRTKKPQIFAESAVRGDGSDWHLAELSMLGDLCIAVPVTVYDNGLHHRPEVHEAPFPAILLYTPGALLRNGMGNTPADWEEATVNDKMDFDAYYSLYERRLLPSFLYANARAESNNKKAFMTIPGLGCGQFAGKFRGQLGSLFKKVLIELLNRQGKQFSSIGAVYYDPYQECSNERHEIAGISFLVRPLAQGNRGKPQLCRPRVYEEEKDNFSDCELFSLVAWDHVSWPGNDFYIGSRSTDDGVKAAATDSMAALTGIEGRYNVATNTYDPPEGYGTWEEVVSKNGIQLDVSDNLMLLPAPS
jgi:hypothetical protein